MEELELDLSENENINKTEERIKNLSSKVKEKAQLAEEANAKAQAEAEARLKAEKERDFYQSFSSHASKFPQASAHIDAIKEKVMAGYAPEDAIVSVLNANNQLMPQDEHVEMAPIAGGSAQTNLEGANKPVGNLSRDEMRAKLMELDKTGELAEAVRNIR